MTATAVLPAAAGATFERLLIPEASHQPSSGDTLTGAQDSGFLSEGTHRLLFPAIAFLTLYSTFMQLLCKGFTSVREKGRS